jgi:hypothetical protein
MSEYILKYSIDFKNQEQCESTHEALNHLCEDSYMLLWASFTSIKAQHLLSNAIEGLMVFLTCKRNANTLTGSFYTSDMELDQQVFQDFIREQSTAKESITIQLQSAIA